MTILDKLNKPEIITATYRIVTPMFIGDAQQKATGISPASVKGALRIWWRALNWGRVASACHSETEALKQLHEEEAILFGSSAYDSENKQRDKDGKPLIGVSRFTLNVVTEELKCGKIDKPSSGVQYLLGQGLYSFREGVLREPIKGGSFSIKCILSAKATDTHKQQLEEALLAFGLLGGMGSRNRKGFGSCAIVEANFSKYDVPQNEEDYKKIIEDLNRGVNNEPPFTAFSDLTNIQISLKGDSSTDLLNKAGNEQQLYRSWGSSKNGGEHKVNGQKAEQNFKQSHDLMESVSNGKAPNTMPEKAAFGLPQNYFFSSIKKNVEFSLAENKRTRRASPLFIHLHQFPNGDCILVHSLFPAVFLKEGEKLEFKVKQRKQTLQYKEDIIDWKVIHTYLERYTDREVVL